MGTKKKRLELLLQKEISVIIQQDLSDPRIGFVTLTSVQLSNDFKLLQVSFSALTDSGEDISDAKIKLFETVLNNSSPTVQKLIAQRLTLRYTPRITFSFDTGLRRSMDISELIRKARESDLDHNQSE